LEIDKEIIVGVDSTGQCVAIIVVIGSSVPLGIFNFGSGKRKERLKDKVFNLWTVEIEVIFDEEEYV
jgi:hypothetical protein